MSYSIAPAANRRLAIALALLPLLVGVSVGFFTYLYIEAQNRELQQLDSRVLQSERERRSLERIIAELDSFERSSDHENLLVQSTSPALAGAKLQGLISKLVEESGGIVDLVQVLEPKEVAPFIEISIRIEAEVSTLGLRRLLHAIENDKPLFAVNKLVVAPLDGRFAQQSDRIDFKADISAFTWGNEQ